MKKLLILLMVLPLVGFSQAESDSTKVWKFGGNASINFSQVSLSNWAAGGKSSASGTFLFNSFANYQKGKISWENSLDLGYGLMKEEDSQSVKTDDKIDFSSKFGLKGKGKIFYSALFNFRTQMADGFKYPDRDNRISTFMAPGYFTLALGADYKPNDKFSLFVSPMTGKMTVVTDDVLSDEGAFGVDPGKKSRGEMGAFLKAQFKTTVVENVSLETKLDLFSNYLDTPQNIDIHWDILLNMKINDYLSANLITNLIYDDDVSIAIDKDGDGVIDEKGPRVQFKELFGVGLSFKF
ncbi:DUF3078 domain-containing protein [Sunxiuqinia elliptica]|uniref:DUF3078 family protein n=1 Tax=Sunxiuqinia elliptica TaxID=655355 RepID=A0A4R6H1M9_9BACT|nr:DUF3078 domain-containing protein [Sunxiuqinia elliptica]TDO01165.1 DUF3078 family protein [Sunxiuqinia elliptica]TDO57676.1 DUF3078 family protein [Sunxiuqinia elliptica]